MLGKRKRDYAGVPRQSWQGSEDEESTNVGNASDLFRKYFEAQFEPLPQESLKTRAYSADEDEDEAEADSQSEASEWSGFTDNETSVEDVRVIEHTVVSNVTGESGASEGKYFMVRPDQHGEGSRTEFRNARAQSHHQLAKLSSPRQLLRGRRKQTKT
jgi:hypothetical protein